ncbi:YciI family protein [Luteimonas sp. RD2P54]|uniref:YciI family protein n=1 Tax=Luteimonas endophytica TaxID=3042023 RepID=A0ABT6J4W8_9GAMM|nr:YciI family protein [Luteimonas endophytica]MDH5821866.1 YciI family protein [Luteimonas endophytica]
MPTFLAIGYGDRAGYDRTAQSVRDAAHAHDEALRQGGALMGIAGHPVQVRNPGAAGQVQTTQGPYLASALPVAGFSVIEATGMAEAIEMAAKTPCAVAHGVVEVWPLEQPQ